MCGERQGLPVSSATANHSCPSRLPSSFQLCPNAGCVKNSFASETSRGSPKSACIHGDFQMGNLILSGERHYWIDLDRFGHGDPMFDVGHLYMLCNCYSSMKYVQGLFHMTREQFHRFWDAFAKAYSGQADHADFDRQAGRFACMDVTLRFFFSNPSLPEALFFASYISRLANRFL